MSLKQNIAKVMMPFGIPLPKGLTRNDSEIAFSTAAGGGFQGKHVHRNINC